MKALYLLHNLGWAWPAMRSALLPVLEAASAEGALPDREHCLWIVSAVSIIVYVAQHTCRLLRRATVHTTCISSIYAAVQTSCTCAHTSPQHAQSNPQAHLSNTVAAGAAVEEVSVDRERFEERAAEYEITDVSAFYSSALFAEHRFSLDEAGARIVLAY